ncbi:hypothetical protein MASR1M45_23870 [Candidatus Kapaibacterium sp.]
MGKTITFFVCLFIFTKYSFSLVQVESPVANQAFCSDSPITFALSSNASNYNIEAYTYSSEDKIRMYGVSSIGNTLQWTPNDYSLMDVHVKFKVFNKHNPDDFAIIDSILIKSKPEIINQTRSAIVCSGETIILSIEAGGFRNSYRWYKDGVLINNETSTKLIIENSDYSASGTYSFEITGDEPCGTVKSEPIAVYVATPTKFASKPDDVEWEHMDTVRVVAPLHTNFDYENDYVKFQWFKDTTVTVIISQNPIRYRIDSIKIKLFDNHRITGSQTQCLQIKDVVWSDRATYSCIAEGMCGTDTTSFMLGDAGMFRITKETPNFYSCEGKDAIFTIKVETSVAGAQFKYQWYKTGFKIIRESEKFIGTKTPTLIIRNGTFKEDQQHYYCLVTLINQNISKRSPSFEYQPKRKPEIVYQTKYWSIRGRRNYEQGLAYLQVRVSNYPPCYYEYFRNGKLIYKAFDKDFRGGSDSASFVGTYVCRISNECGETWSDTMYVAYGYNDVGACLGNDLILKADDLGDNYRFTWIKDNDTINESSRFINTDKNILTIRNTIAADEGDYYIWATNIETGEARFLGTMYVEIIEKPYMIRDLPDYHANEGDYMRIVSVTVISKGLELHFELYIDGELVQKGTKKRNINNYTDYGFVLGGKSSNLKPGIYQYRFYNECGDEVWSNKMKLVNTVYKPGGIVFSEEDKDAPSNIILNKEFIANIYPNPATEYITINLSSINPTLKHEVESVVSIEILDVIGVKIHSIPVGTQNIVSLQQRIDVSNLASGLYFVKIGGFVEKFVKM